ncbi:UbiX family flavin prenyltransferase [Haladaptatus sp. F3-133]|uniref:Flavin prenyltransferase UbiX n=1 Tax=Halorutilus salinus TaxID=2487751 RepID=A0A9Q4C619_9EURY|nr:UbiX family flavin prenyltransferase [Halorutilus salinus]MCX2819913.1 UbiX family flavin prenyltransferase [Halorutilus salinus]
MKIVVGITGASGVQYGVAALRLLVDTDVESHVIVTGGARRVLDAETDLTPAEVEGFADVAHSPTNVGASVASGSFDFDGMLVCPCSMKTLGYVANGIAEGLVPRVADVCLKEERRLVLVPRESPMARTHLENALEARKAGAVVAPASPGFYTRPETVDEVVEVFAAKLLDGFGVETDAMERWTG